MRKIALGIALAVNGALIVASAWSASAQGPGGPGGPGGGGPGLGGPMGGPMGGGPMGGGPMGGGPMGGGPTGGGPTGGGPTGGGPGGGGNGGGQTTPSVGGPLAGLTTAQLADFEAGRREFTKQQRIEDGLGPVFNARSCAECHGGPVPGGSGGDLGRTTVVRIGRLLNGVFDGLEGEGGSQLQRRSIRELDPRCPIVGEVVPASATIVSSRATPPVFGIGLIEAISEADISGRADPNDTNRDGISGRVNRMFNPETGRTEIGRFGWKGLVPTVHLFTAGAYQGELGITNPTFPVENLPQGKPIPAGWDKVAEPEEGGSGVELATRFQRWLAPPQQKTLSTAAVRGQQLFTSTGCAACHTPSIRTSGTDPVLGGKTAALYSDLLLHDMGPGLADGVPQEQATGGEWRTTPLWGTSLKRNWLHDGRARSIDESVRLHGGESAASATKYRSLTPQDRDALLQFLNAL